MGIIQQSNQTVLIVLSRRMLKIALCTFQKVLTIFKYAGIPLATHLACWIYATRLIHSIYMGILVY